MNEEDLKQRLKDRNLRITANRLGVLKEINSFPVAISHSRLQHVLKSRDRVSLYRTINSLIEGGLIHKVSASGQENYYALCEETCQAEKHQHKHIHFECDSCREIYCLPLQQEWSLDTGNFKLKSFEVLATGICEDCVSRPL
jgi:Fur family ferric uptake transcriptional regulator